MIVVCLIKQSTIESKNFLKGVQTLLIKKEVVVCSDKTVQKVEEMIRTDMCLTIDSIANAVVSSQGFAYSIMHEHVQY